MKGGGFLCEHAVGGWEGMGIGFTDKQQDKKDGNAFAAVRSPDQSPRPNINGSATANHFYL